MTPADAARMLIEWEQTKMLYALALLAGIVVVGLGAKWWEGRRGGSINENPNPAPKGPPPVVQTRPPSGRSGNPSVNEAQWVSDGKGGVRWLVPAEHEPKPPPAPPPPPRR